MDKYQNLKKNIKGVQNEKWTIENIKDGFEYFNEINGRYPSSREIDDFEYLPSRKMIERNFGGLVNLKNTLNIQGPNDFTKGEVRSAVAQKAFKRSQDYEKEFYKYLISKIPEVRVHEHKIIRPGDTAADFFVYTTETNGFVVDLFYAMDTYSLGGILNIKQKKYLNVEFPVYFVLIGNDEINQETIDKLVKNRKNQLSNHIKVLTEGNFKKLLMSLLRA